MILFHLRLKIRRTLKHLEEVEPHCKQDIVVHEPEGDRRMREHIVQVGNKGPVAMVAHHMFGAVHVL